MRALLLHLRPVHLSGDSLQQGIEKLIEEIKQHTPLHVELSIPQDLSLPEAVEEHMFRIIQDDLSIVLCHAVASDVLIYISERRHEFFLDQMRVWYGTRYI